MQPRRNWRKSKKRTETWRIRKRENRESRGRKRMESKRRIEPWRISKRENRESRGADENGSSSNSSKREWEEERRIE